MIKPALIITIDTEGDNLWENHKQILTKNALFLPRFQNLCEKYKFKPVYLTNYEMVMNQEYVAFACEVISSNLGEIGMHLHAWNSPPINPLTTNDWHYKPYLIEYPKTQMRSKIKFLTDILEQTFQTKMLSHRAGRWAFNKDYAALLIEFGYLIDCSVTPKVIWHSLNDHIKERKNIDYSAFPDYAYFIDENNIDSVGNSPLLEVPMTIEYRHSTLLNTLKSYYNWISGKGYASSVDWLRPTGRNLKKMKQVVQKSINKGCDYVEFMLHSSEFMPGGSPTFSSKHDIENLYQDLEYLFDWLSKRTVGKTLHEFYQDKIKHK